MERVTFESDGIPLVGHLHLPPGATAPAPAVVIIGPMTYVKEQAPSEYARRLAAAGFAALVFDCRFHGESGGTPRRWEHPLAKVADIRAAARFLAGQAAVDGQRIAGLGICQGSSEMIRALAEDATLRAGATIAGHYRDLDADVQWLGEAARQLRLERGWKARLRFAETGEVEYVPAIDAERMDVGMPGGFVWDWYHPWAERGIWDNRYAVMSDADLLGYESLSAAARLTKPFLMIHSDNCFLPDAARRHFAAIPGTAKALSWQGTTPHLAYYDEPAVIDPTVAQLGRFLSNALA
ncbi:alpha/beta hydrolase [Roseomonas sp. F4]